MKQKSKRNALLRRGMGAGLSLAMALSLFGAIPTPAAELSETASQKPIMRKAGSVPASEDQVTYDEPFASGTAGSVHFRIPTLITLQDGTLLGAADARWETTGDGGGLDSIVSISEDGGKTWQYSFPLFFPDSNGYQNSASNVAEEKRATTIIDPGVVEGPDGTIYFIADVNPSGSTTMYKTIPTGTGYVTVDNDVDSGRFLALTQDFDTSFNVEPADDNLTAYPYYVSTFESIDDSEDLYAEIRLRSDGSSSGYGVDEWYNLYTITDGEYVDDLTQTQVNDSNFEIQQNAFYVGSMFHVYSIDYLWVITSKDGGRTWEHPRDLTDEIKRPETENALLVSPGQGISTACGDIVIGFYDHGPAGNNQENASVVYSTDNGQTWERTEDVPDFWSSENEIVELLDGTLRMFVRSGQGQICYADSVKNEDGGYTMADHAVRTGVSSTSTCNVTAISYSKKIDGKQVIIVGCPTGGTRAKGKLFIFLVEEDNTMTLFDEFNIPGSANGYVYSCLTEMEDGTLALLWEPNDWGNRRSILFDTFSILDIAPEADVEEAVVNVTLEKGETYERTYQRAGEISADGKEDRTVAEVTAESDGTTRTVTITGLSKGYTETLIDNVLYKISITEEPPIRLEGIGTEYVMEDAYEAGEDVSNDFISLTSTATGTKVFDHKANIRDSLDSFSATPNSEAEISDMEFTFTQSGDNWRAYNEKKNVYLASNSAAQYFTSGAADLKVVAVDGKFRICKSNGNRYVMFYYPNMDFNSNDGGYKNNYTDGIQEMTLLEKQDAISADDVIPGYRLATTVTSGKKYLIGYQHERGMILLYPQNGTANQTKLVRPTYKIVVTAEGIGESSVVIAGKKYPFKVTSDECTHEETKTIGAIRAGCFTDGYTGDIVCTNPDCELVIEVGTVIPAIGSHDWGEKTLVKPVTAEEDGEWAWTCQNDPFHKKTEVIYASSYAYAKEEYDKALELLENSKGLYTDETIAALETAFEENSEVVTVGATQNSAYYKLVEAFQAAMGSLERKSTEDLWLDLDNAALEAERLKKAAKSVGVESLPDGLLDALNAAYDAEQPEDDATESEIWAWTSAMLTANNNLQTAISDLEKARNDIKSALADAAKLYDGGKGADVYTVETWGVVCECLSSRGRRTGECEGGDVGEPA